MILSDVWQGRRYAVFGLARSGLASVNALVKSGCKVACWDDRAEARAAANPFAQRVNFLEEGLEGYDSLVVSPGVPINLHPIADMARGAGCEIIGDVELFARVRGSLPTHAVVGITGTNGKSTTTALVDHILREARVPSVAAGNIGEPILSLEPLDAGGVYVLELSSYQIDLTTSLDCDVAVLLNITPDHLDRYDGSFEKYAASKARLFDMQSDKSVAVDMRTIGVSAKAGVQAGGSTGPRPSPGNGGAGWSDALRGPHNLENATAAILTCSALGLEREAIERGLASFKGLPHRMEIVGERDGVQFVNDSKATNADATAPALAAFTAIRWIVGGEAKADGLEPLLNKLGAVRKAYLVGASSKRFAASLDGRVETVRADTVENAVKLAAADAEPGDTVLLSPACASFDQFRDFEARGEAFRAAVEDLPCSS